jgi:hypothetical protein
MYAGGAVLKIPDERNFERVVTVNFEGHDDGFEA